MKVIDLHCDALLKLSLKGETLSFVDSDDLHTNKRRLLAGEVKIQFFAIFIKPDIPQHEKFMSVLQQIELFHTKVLTPNPEMVHITDWSQLNSLEENQIGAVLSLEGADAIGEDLGKLHAILDAGIKLVGLTWNQANAIADGADVNSNRGLTQFGREVVQVLNDRDILIDVSHLSEKSFWDVLENGKHVIASHSNAKSLCDHPRNLTDAQATALVNKGGHIHLVYYPPFIRNDKEQVTIEDLMQHFVHLANLVGVQHLGLGSDFDGISIFIKDLENASHTQNIVNGLKRHFSEEEVHGIAENNFMEYIKKVSAKF